jgi:glycosyltransferase involved in cell wall biosynthesis
MSSHPSDQRRETVSSGGIVSSIGEGRLDGLTILRFAHASTDGAGLEYDIAVINRALGLRNKIKTIWIHFAQSSDELITSTATEGRGTLVKVPVPAPVVPSKNEHANAGPGDRIGQYLSDFFRDHVVFNPWLSRTVFNHWLTNGSFRTHNEDVAGIGLKVRELIKQHAVDLVVLHSLGGSDAAEILGEARVAAIPVILHLHFANERYLHCSIRRQVLLADGVCGVSDVRVPRYLRGRFTNLLTGLDTGFFQRENCNPLELPFQRPTLFLPARITPTKGHDDLITIAAKLRERGMSVNVVFAGRADQPAYEVRLKQRIASLKLEPQFYFAGLLDPAALRDWYGACDLLAFPTYHHEGLPRVLLEAQAMKLPVVAYDTGGTRAGFLNGQSGYLIRPGDIESFVRHVHTLLTHPSRQREMANAARSFVEEKFCLRALAERHEDFYLNILSAHQRHMAANRTEIPRLK